MPYHENFFPILVKKKEGFKLTRGPLRPWEEESKTEIEKEPEGGSWSGQRVGGKDSNPGELQTRWIPYAGPVKL